MGKPPSWVLTPPARFDIVTVYYPERGSDKPGPVLRPSLVMAVFQEQSSKAFACHVAFGTKNLKLLDRQHLDVIVQNAAHLRQFGLYIATRFDLDYTITLPWTEEYFGCWNGFRSPTIGKFTEDYIKDFAYLMMRRQSVTPDN